MPRMAKAGVIALLAGAGVVTMLGARQAAPANTSEGRGPIPSEGNEWCVVHLTHGELGLDMPRQQWDSNGRIRNRNGFAFAAEGRFVSFEGGWLRIAGVTAGEVWIPEHAILAVEYMPREAFQWRDGPPPGRGPDGSD